MPKRSQRKWLDRQWEIYQAEASTECRTCQGRVHGDCSDQCRYYPATAQEVDNSSLAASESGWVPTRWRLWEGPTGPPVAAESE
jgi:hypothetical protein